ncbi:NAD+ synthase [Mangrovactinospora gilvigrisea]|uniref:Glutamine-dependent NAD(+) synthetase n=1 Tax=Mangrovactinospora gilvigrisea TaxID=1428644 RepID=A0A1J7BCA1_9ACTN|nr:NAD+ synthase [Mangrovactinospora gilvigrisea]OIV36270.1 NAD+ synthase [Mangrovactinospora gilvigrisea]
MPQLRLALAQLDPTVGDLGGNAALVVRAAHRAAARGAHLLATPELALPGYPVEDLALRPAFVAASRHALTALAARLADEGLGGLPVAVGYLGRSEHDTRLPQNCAAVLHEGRVAVRTAKHHLPNYGVFDEFRYFAPGEALAVVRVHGVDVALAVCEDLWQDGGPVVAAREARAGLLLALNASPYEAAKDDTRLALCRRRAREAGCALGYVNLVGGQDELVFDGDSLVVGADGELLARSPQFHQDLLVLDLDLPRAAEDAPEHGARLADGLVLRRAVVSPEPLPPYQPEPAPRAEERFDDDAEVYAALVLGLGDYCRKNGVRTAFVALSGGIDSALTAAIAVDALGAANVHGVSLPSSYSSGHSQDDAAELARRTGLHYRTIAIAPMVEAYQEALKLTGLAEENLQARVRGTAMMGLSNASPGSILLATGNKSELAVGYSTLYGDAAGGYAPIKDVPKTQVWQLSRWRNAEAARRGEQPPIPENSITKPPSAELRPDQLDTDSLPDYPVLDGILDRYVERDQGRAEIVADGYDAALVDRVIALVDGAEYKRRQYPPGTKISLKAFGRDRRLPITNRWRENGA